MSDLEGRIASLERTVAALQRQLRQPIGFARSTAAPVDTGKVQTIQGQMDALSKRDAMPVLFHYGFSSSMPVDGDKVIGYLTSDRSSGVVIATGHQQYRLTGLSTGEVALYDMWGRSVVLGSGGVTINANNAPIDITNGTTVTVHAPLLRCTGDIQDNYEHNSQTMASMRQIYDEHTHGNVQNGGGHTSVPDQVM